MSCNTYQKRFYVKLRISNHSLLIETKRYCSFKVPREQRICQFCKLNEVEDEMHFLFRCTAYTDIRNTFMSKINTYIDSTKSNILDNIICSQSASALYCFVKYINKCFEKRKSLPQDTLTQ